MIDIETLKEMINQIISDTCLDFEVEDILLSCFKAIEQLQAENEKLKNNQLPLELTAENGAKGLLSSEFFETYKSECWDCEGSGGVYSHISENDVECHECKGYGTHEEKIHVSWTTIKDIYKKWVNYRLPKPPEGDND